jgi:RND family efflux transporter MFP subunit
MSEITQNESSQSPTNKHQWIKGVVRFMAYWFKLIAQPALAVLFVLGVAWLFGYAQRNFNWFNDAATSITDAEAKEDSLYACSMLCVFVKAPGRCPVCGMELQEIEVKGDPKDIFGVTIDPTARRLANIKTVAALNLPVSKETEVLGKIAYDETSESTISAYVDGRIVDLLVDFTGAQVKKGEPLAVLYSPDLYADQVGLLNAKRLLEENSSSNERTIASNRKLYESARRRLVEFGLPTAQVDDIEERGEPDSNIRIVAPISGTCVEKLVKEGDYIKTGMPIMKLADLSNVWLMLEMFPEDTCNLQLGQTVTITIQSQVGQKFEGTISFIDPMVNQKTNTVNVRVEIPNKAGLIKIGDFGRAKIKTNHPADQEMVVVPRGAVLINGSDSIAYVETELGRFEFRKVEIAEIMGDKISLSAGIKPGEMVAASGVFMLDSTFNIQGKVSLIDPNRAARKNQAKLAEGEEAREIKKALSKLNAEDRKLAEEQVICPVMEVKLGSAGMGTPIRVELPDRDVMICCEGCRKKLVAEPQKYYVILDDYHSDAPSAEELAEIEESFAPLSPEDRKLSEEQVICPVTEVRLGTMGMGTPIRVDVNGTPIMICCEGCRKGLLKEPEKNFQILKDYHEGNKKTSALGSENDSSSSDVPQMEIPQMEIPQMEIPQMELPKMELPK